MSVPSRVRKFVPGLSGDAELRQKTKPVWVRKIVPGKKGKIGWELVYPTLIGMKNRTQQKMGHTTTNNDTLASQV